MKNKSHLTLAKEVIAEKNEEIARLSNIVSNLRASDLRWHERAALAEEVLEKISAMRPFHDTCSLDNCPVCTARKALKPQ